MKQTFQQVRGSAIGNQVSPTLANLAVSVLEVDWRRRCDDPAQRFSSRLFTTRYVDNRLTLADEHLLDFSFLSIFSDLAFYQPPVQPECVPGDEGDQFLGFHIHPASRKLVFVQPQEDFQFRPFLAAGTVANKYAPVQSRMATAARYSFPFAQAEEDTLHLARTYIDRGFPEAKVMAIRRKFLQLRVRSENSLAGPCWKNRGCAV